MKPVAPSFSKTILLAGLFFIAGSVHAASVSVVVTPSPVQAGKPFTAVVRLHTGSESLNAVDGSIAIPDGLSISSVSLGASALALWIKTPVYVIRDKSIVFTGGTPKGLPSGADLELFTFTGSGTLPGTYPLTSKGITAYKNDGKGTLVPTTLASSTVRIGGTTSGTVPATAKDTVAPAFVDASIGRDPALFGGKYFVSFIATDTGGGVDHYEIQEGWLKPFVRASQIYVLADQTLSSTITIVAYDKAGNTARTTIPATHPRVPFWFYGIGVLSLLILSTVVWRLRKKKTL